MAQIKVGLVDERSFPAKLVGIDGFTDLAVMKVDVKGAASRSGTT